jgi:hypothetical protein
MHRKSGVGHGGTPATQRSSLQKFSYQQSLEGSRARTSHCWQGIVQKMSDPNNFFRGHSRMVFRPRMPITRNRTSLTRHTFAGFKLIACHGTTLWPAAQSRYNHIDTSHHQLANRLTVELCTLHCPRNEADYRARRYSIDKRPGRSEITGDCRKIQEYEK